MYAIKGIATAEEPLVDKSRIDDTGEHPPRRGSSLPEDLDEIFPAAKWTRAIYDERKRRFPQTIAHRGYKASHPENTMNAFKGAVEVGTHAIETDIHLSRDGVVVLSHDRDLKRCFGRKEKIIDCDWQFLSQQRTSRAPHEPMPRLSDLLEYLAQPEQQSIWLLLDIKIDNDANDVMRLIGETIRSVPSGPHKWEQRIVMGIWAVRYLPLCAQYVPGFPISHIGVSTRYARQFLKISNCSFNILQKMLLGPMGTHFIRDVKKANRELFVWTVNEVSLMRWSIQKEVDGVITDDPKLFREVCDKWIDNEPPVKPDWSQWLYTFWLYILLTVYWVSIKKRFPETVEMFLQKEGSKPKRTIKS